MPQMAPLMWLILFMSFIIIFIMFNILNYFNYTPNNMLSNQENNLFKQKNLNLFWKW